MNIQVVRPRLFTSIGLLLTLTVSAQPALTYAGQFEPICQVSSASGFCNEITATLFSTLASNMTAMPEAAPAVFNASDFGTFNRPFSVNSLWNVRPRFVTLGTAVIPESTYYPLIATGKYSTTAFQANPTDTPMTVYPPTGAYGVWDPDAEASLPSVTIPHWPADTVSAIGSDGHADIVDVESGVVHSFWQLRNTGGRWSATQYAWSPLGGRGWGDGAHYFQGARAAGVPSMAGLIRKHEINDGASQYYHALAMSLTYNGMSRTEQYVFPATSGDRTWKDNTGTIPTGALMMLPPSFDATKISNPDLRKVVNTLKTYGAYVVDRNVGTPFYIYVENGADFNLHRGGWNSAVGNDLQRIRAALRQVTNAKEWVNNLGEPVTTLPPLNASSMRGPWRPMLKGGAIPVYDSTSQSVVFGKTDKVYWAESASDRSIPRVRWAKPVKGKLYEFKVQATNGGRAYLRFWGAGAEQFNTRALGNGQSYRFYWPMMDGVSILGVVSGIGDKTVVQSTLNEVLE